MLKFALIFLFCISLYSKDITASAQLPDHKENKFPHRMWMFWDTNIEKAPIFIQLCVNNLRHFAEVSGWELILLSNENIFNYLSPETSEKLRDMKSKIGKVSPTALSDLHRIFVMYENGGMWIDISSVMVRDLSWVQDIQNQQIIKNRPSPQPELVMYVHHKHFALNKTVVFDEKLQKQVQLFPGLENWSFLAKPKSKFMRDIIDRYGYMATKNNVWEYIDQSERQGNIYLNERGQYHFYGSFVFQDVMQRKQREIDRNRKDFSERYAVEYYQIWTMDAMETAFLFEEANLWILEGAMRSFFYESIETLTHQKYKSVNFLKFIGQTRSKVDEILKDSVSSNISNCRSASILPFPKESIFRKYLLEYSQDFEYVKKLNSIQQRKSRVECELFPDSFYIDISEMTSIAGIIFLILVFIIFSVLWFLRSIRYYKKINESLE